MGNVLALQVNNAHLKPIKRVKYALGVVASGLLVFLWLGSPNYAAEVSLHHQTASGLPGWLLKDPVIEIQLNPLKRDQVHAFYSARGFSDEIAELIAQNCVYQTVVQNVSTTSNPTHISLDLSHWRVIDSRSESRLITKQAWLKKWSAMGAGHSALIAFEWATFPWQQDFELTGDDAWGMILFGPVEGESFDLIIQWQVNGMQHEQNVAQLVCPGEEQ